MEVQAHKDLLKCHGLKPEVLLVERDQKYFDFSTIIKSLPDIKRSIEEDPDFVAQEKKLYEAFAKWWSEYNVRLTLLPGNNNVMALRSDYLKSFEETLVPIGLLDRFKIAGVIASWWNNAYDELKTVVAQGFTGLIDGWVQTIRDFVEGEDESQSDDFKPLEHKIVAKLIPDYLQELSDAEIILEQLKSEQESFERGEHLEDSDEEYDGKEHNYAKELEDQAKTLKARLIEHMGRVSFPSFDENTNSPSPSEFLKKLAKTKAAAKAIVENVDELEGAVEELIEIERLLRPYKKIKKDLLLARRKYRQLKTELVKRLEEARKKLTAQDDQNVVLDLIREEIGKQLGIYVSQHRQQVVDIFYNWWFKYEEPLHIVEEKRSSAAHLFQQVIKELGYDK